MLQHKVCLVGDFAVGKTSLFNRFVYNRFSEHYTSTFGVRVQRKSITVDQAALSLILWDIEGGHASHGLQRTYVAGATGAVIVCDLTRPQTISHVRRYVDMLLSANQYIQLVLAANKADLVPPSDSAYTMLDDVGREYALPIVLTSAQTGVGIDATFNQLSRDLVYEQHAV